VRRTLEHADPALRLIDDHEEAAVMSLRSPPVRTLVPFPVRPFALLLMLAAVALCTACAGSRSGGTPTATPMAPGAEITLTPGQTISLGSTAWELRFVEATNDSRCPKGVQCIRAGDVTLHFFAADPSGAISNVSVRFGEGDATAAVGPLTVEVLAVQPTPIAGQPIPPADYRVTLTAR
jgi:hypothetical protein